MYNAAKFIAAAAESALRQCGIESELILVDDGSTDGSGAMCDEIARRDSRCRVVHTPNRGVSAARNAGLEASRSEWVTFLDADDLLAPDALKRMLAIALGNDVEIVCGGFKEFSGSEVNFPESEEEDILILDSAEAVRDILYQRRGHNSTCAVLYKRSAWASERFREGRYEDLDAFYRVMLPAGKVAITSTPFYGYRSHGESFVHSFSEQRIDVLDVCDRMCAFMERHYPQLLAAAEERRLSAAFNIFGLISANKPADENARQRLRRIERRCKDIILRQRFNSLTDKRVRLKSKVGALLSYFGWPTLRMLSKIVYR